MEEEVTKMKVPIENADKFFKSYFDIMDYKEFISDNKLLKPFIVIGHIDDGYCKPDISIWLDGHINIHSNLSIFNIWASSDDWRPFEKSIVSAIHVTKYIINNNIDKFSYISITHMLNNQLKQSIPDIILSYKYDTIIDDKTIPITKNKCDKKALEKIIGKDSRWEPVVMMKSNISKKSFYILPYGGIMLSDNNPASVNFDEFIKLITLANTVLLHTATYRYNLNYHDYYIDEAIKLI